MCIDWLSALGNRGQSNCSLTKGGKKCFVHQVFTSAVSAKSRFSPSAKNWNTNKSVERKMEQVIVHIFINEEKYDTFYHYWPPKWFMGGSFCKLNIPARKCECQKNWQDITGSLKFSVARTTRETSLMFRKTNTERGICYLTRATRVVSLTSSTLSG